MFENNTSSHKFLKFAKLCSSLQLQAVLQCCIAALALILIIAGNLINEV